MDFTALIPTLEQYGAPLIAKLLTAAAYAAGGPLVGAVAGKILDAIASAIGAPSSDPAAIQTTIQADPTKAQAALQKVEAEHAAVIQAAISQAQIDEQNLENARAMQLQLVQNHSPLAWGAPIISAIAVGGFFVICGLMLFHVGDQAIAQGILGAMTVGWTTVLTYWCGSSKGSADKTNELATIARQAAASPARKR